MGALYSQPSSPLVFIKTKLSGHVENTSYNDYSEVQREPKMLIAYGYNANNHMKTCHIIQDHEEVDLEADLRNKEIVRLLVYNSRVGTIETFEKTINSVPIIEDKTKG